jgi:putative ABC transport system permease protein
MTLGIFTREVTKEMRASRLGVFFMSLGMVIAVLSITLITSLGEGTRIKITEILEQLNFGSNAFLLLAGGGKFFGSAQTRRDTLTLEDISIISRYDFVTGVSPGQFAFRPVSYGGKVYKTRINGVMPQWSPLAHWEVAKGRFVTSEDLRERAKVAVLGWKTAKDLFGDADPLGKYVKISGILFRVVGVLESKGSVGRHPLDLRVVIPLTTSQRRLLNRDWLDVAKIVISPSRDVHQAQRLIAQLLRRRHHIVPPKPDDFRIITSEQIIAFLTKATHTLTVMLLLIGTISLVVSGIIITNIMLAVITQRKKIIGIRRALGATRKEIMMHYTMFSLSVALLGGVIGLILGILLAKAVAQVSPIPARAPWYIFVAAPLFSLITGGVFGLHPARKAANLSPVESLR